MRAMNAAAANGTWVLLQNCELGLGLMNEMEDFLGKLREGMDPAFRLFITALPHPEFPLGLLQMSKKVRATCCNTSYTSAAERCTQIKLFDLRH